VLGETHSKKGGLTCVKVAIGSEKTLAPEFALGEVLARCSEIKNVGEFLLVFWK
jgi:hypothetical protein